MIKKQNPGDMYNAYKMKIAKKQSKSHEKKETKKHEKGESKSFEKKEQKGLVKDRADKKKKKVAKKTYTKTPVMTEALMKSAYEDARRNNKLGIGFGGEPKQAKPTVKQVKVTIKKK